MVPGAARLWATAVSKKVEGLTSLTARVDPGTALKVDGWLRIEGKTRGVGRGLF